MKESEIGLVVIGRSPRPNLTKELLLGCKSDRKVVQIGALDGLSHAEIAALGPKNDAETLFTTLPDGTDIRVSKQEVFQRIDACLQQLEACGVSVALMCCSGVFPGFESRMRLIEPSRILAGMAEAALPRGRLGLLTPLPEQVEHLIQQWQRDGVDVVGEAVAPGSDKQAFEVAAGSLAAQAPDLIVMDCMAYTAAERASVRRVYDGPIILAISACGRFIDELVT